MYKFQRPARALEKKNSNVSSIKDDAPQLLTEVDEVDRATPSQFDPNSTSTSIYDYEDTFDDPAPVKTDSLPAQVAHLNNLDSVYFYNVHDLPHQQHWEAEDVGDFITTLDESTSSIEAEYATVNRVHSKSKMRPKSMYNPASHDLIYGQVDLMTTSVESNPASTQDWSHLMTTSCYGELTAEENLNRIGSEPQLDISLDLSPSTLAQLDGFGATNTRQWMASTEELMNIETMIQQRVTVDVHSSGGGAGGDDWLNTSATEDNIVSLENSYCEPQQVRFDLTERAESGEWM